MLIRSQNKISLVKFENIVININNINGKEIICWSQMNPGEDEAYADAALIPMAVPNIGKMFAEAPVSKENELLAEAIGEVLMNKMVFQMPEDGSVEI